MYVAMIKGKEGKNAYDKYFSAESDEMAVLAFCSALMAVPVDSAEDSVLYVFSAEDSAARVVATYLGTRKIRDLLRKHDYDLTKRIKDYLVQAGGPNA